MANYPLLMIFPREAKIAVPTGCCRPTDDGDKMIVTYPNRHVHAWLTALSLAIAGAMIPAEVLEIMHSDWIETPGEVVEGVAF